MYCCGRVSSFDVRPTLFRMRGISREDLNGFLITEAFAVAWLGLALWIFLWSSWAFLIKLAVALTSFFALGWFVHRVVVPWVRR